MTRWLLLLLLLAAAPAWSQTIVRPDALGNLVLTQNQAGLGNSAAAIDTRAGYYSIIITYFTTTGSATVTTQVSCDGVHWLPTINSTKNIDTANPDGFATEFPACAYRTVVTVCTGCNVTTQGTVTGSFR